MCIYIYKYISTRINHPSNQSVYKIIYIYIIQKQPEIPAIRSAFFTNPVPCHSWVLTGRWLLMEPTTSRLHRAGLYRYEFHVWNHFCVFVFKKMARNMCGVKLQCWKDYSVNAVGHSMFSLWMDVTFRPELAEIILSAEKFGITNFMIKNLNMTLVEFRSSHPLVHDTSSASKPPF